MGQLDRQSRWSLTDLFPDPLGNALEDALAQLEQALCAFEATRERLTPEILDRAFHTSFDFLLAAGGVDAHPHEHGHDHSHEHEKKR